MSPTHTRPIRIAGACAAAIDRRGAMAAFGKNYPNDPIDVIIGDWMAEANMSTAAFRKQSGQAAGYEPSFLDNLEPALPYISEYAIKVVVNAGAADTKGLYDRVVSMLAKKSMSLNVVWISGDEVLDAVQDHLASGSTDIEHICTGQKLRDWKFKPIYAQCYLGAMGIATALERGADIVVCGRVSDASPVIGAAAWWNSWDRGDIDRLANSFVAGHLIECGSYICGGNFSGFKKLEAQGWDDIGFPIAEISALGEVVITKQKGSGGIVSVDTCKAQVLYEIQGPWYYNSDVTAILSDVYFEQVGKDRVALRGVKGDLPPPTTKVGITAQGGYQAELHYALVGLDIEDKVRMLEAQIRYSLGSNADRFSVLDFTVMGVVPEDPEDQNSATVDFRILAQAPRESDLSAEAFLRPVLEPVIESYPGATYHYEFRTGVPRPIYEYFVTLLPQSAVLHTVHLANGESVEIPPPENTKIYPAQQPSGDTESGVNLEQFGETVRGPLGWIVHGRSGDKSSNCNVGFWVRNEDEWDWLRTILSIGKIKKLLGREYKGGKIDRFELPKAWGVHFLLHDHLDRGVSCSKTYDPLGKNVAEFLRSRHVDLPLKYLNRGRI